ncbi:MAG: type II toxin-antitoxin system death-on-curing family toxin [Clostridiales bacterium]|nr:type II toxin-antitoxin system death-on-curing family toxin [Clostridiales bacterium]
MIVLSRDQILLLHTGLIKRYGGIHGVRDESLLDSALNAPFQSFGDQEFYPTIVEKAARLGFGLIKNHPFCDGNKRTGAMVTLMMLKLNAVNVEAASEEIIKIFMGVASGEFDETDLVLWIKDHII